MSREIKVWDKITEKYQSWFPNFFLTALLNLLLKHRGNMILQTRLCLAQIIRQMLRQVEQSSQKNNQIKRCNSLHIIQNNV